MESIKYLNRSTGKVEVEHVYGEKWLKFTYNHFLGRFFLWFLAKRKVFSFWYGVSANNPKSKQKILPFIQKFKVDESEFLEPTSSFSTFNEFFYRRLKPSARPIASSNAAVIFPADGRHFGFQNVSNIKSIFVKGQHFDLSTLFGSKERALPYENGSLIISRLCPVDYHRFHFPCDGTFQTADLINGKLFSVNPIALRKKISIFWENKRYLSYLESESFGTVAQFAIGATCVGTVTYTGNKETFVKKGDELGFFSFGGSCILTLFEKDKILLNQDLIETSKNEIELYAKMGEQMGVSKNFV